MTRLVCIGDCHFGPQGGRNEDRYRSLDHILDYGLHLEGLGAWLFAGDLNHAKMTIDDRNQLAPRLQRMADAAPVLIIRGNHDADGDLEIFSRLAARFPIAVVTACELRTFELATGDRAAVFCIPYIFRASLVAAGVAHGDLGQAARERLDPMFIAGAHALQEAIEAGQLPVVFGHLNIGGSVSSVGQPQIGQEIELDPALLARFPAVPKLFGHIHKHQSIHDAWFLGSIARMDYGENEDKVFGVVEFDGSTDWRIEFVPLEVPAQLHIEGHLTREAFTWELVGTGDARPPTFAGADVRVRYTYVKAEAGALDVARIHAAFAGCRSLKLDPVPVLEHQVRAPEIVAAATIDEKVERYAERHGIQVTDGFRAKLAALQSQDATALLSQVATEVSSAGAVERDAEQAVA